MSRVAKSGESNGRKPGRPAHKLTRQEKWELAGLRATTSLERRLKHERRERISRLASMGVPMRTIAEAAGVHTSNVERQIARERKCQ